MYELCYGEMVYNADARTNSTESQALGSCNKLNITENYRHQWIQTEHAKVNNALDTNGVLKAVLIGMFRMKTQRVDCRTIERRSFFFKAYLVLYTKIKSTEF